MFPFKKILIAAAASATGAMFITGAYAQQGETELDSALEELLGSPSQSESVSDSPAAAPAPAPAPAQQQAPAAAAAPSAVAPAAAEPRPRSLAIEEIVVTARRREESIQTVPVAVTAVSGDALTRAGVTDVNAIATQVPNLVITPSSSGSRSIPTFAIRGQSQQEQSIISDPSVPVYFNEVAVQRPHGINQALFDVQSVEVLKGPQGTLFGRNSTGGAVLIRPNRPSEEFEGYVGVTVGSFNRFNTTAMVNQPLNDWAQLRVAGQTTDSDGYLNDVVLDRNINHEHTKAGRISFAMQPIEGLDSVFTYSRFLQNDGATGALLTQLNPGSITNSGHPAAPSFGFVGDRSGEQMLADQQARGLRDTASGVEQYTRVSTRDLSNITTYELSDSLSIKNVMGSRRVDSDTFDDVDGTPVPLMHINRISEFKQFSNEFQLLGSTDTLTWIAGAYFFQEEGGSNDYSVTAKGVASGPGSQTPQPKPTEFPGWSLTSPFGKNTSKSVFAQGTQSLESLVEGLSVTLGVRYTWDEREARIRNRTGNATDPAGTPVCRFSRDLDGDPSTPETPAAEVPIDQCDVTFTKKFSEPTWNFSLDYKVAPEHLIYVANRRGYRTGGFGARASSELALAQTFDAETVMDYEIGSKSTFDIAGMPLRINLAVFYSDYQDIQRLLTEGSFNPPQTVPVNAGKATIKGGEFEFTFMPTENLELSGFWSYTDAGYDEFVDPFNGNDLSGQPFARAPENIYSVTTRYHVPVSSTAGQVSLQASYFHTDGYSTNDTYHPLQSIEGYEIVNLRADWQNVMGSNFDMGLALYNALDEEYLLPFSDLYTTPVLGHISRTPGTPRSIGFDIRYRFGAAAY